MTKQEVIAKIIDVTERYCDSKLLRIYEISSLDDLIPFDEAERLRKLFVLNKPQIRQVTNKKRLYTWTEQKQLPAMLQARYVPKDILDITTEMLIFDDTVVSYRLTPEPFYSEITDAGYARLQESTFDHMWSTGDQLLLGPDGSSQSKQYEPFTHAFGVTPVVIYPLKDDAVITKAFSRTQPGCLEAYVDELCAKNDDFIKGADMIVALVWNQDTTPMCDVWRVDRNRLSDDSGFLYDVRVFKGFSPVTDMGIASGNTSIVITAEEMLLRDLVMTQGLTFKQAADRKTYRAKFPLGYVPDEEFYDRFSEDDKVGTRME
jgi:hypothetical protein